jgi:hypothetical protein
MENANMLDQSVSVACSRARDLLANLPNRKQSADTVKNYRKTFTAMWWEQTLDPLRAGDGRGTYLRRRAALHWGAARMLERLLARLETATSSGDHDVARRIAAVLTKVVDRLEPALKLDPPLQGQVADFTTRTRWENSKAAKQNHRKRDKKGDLARLPRDWRERVWNCVPANSSVRDAVAVHSLSPARGGELQPGPRPTGFSAGVTVALTKKGELVISTRPLKTADGKFGMVICAVKIDIALEGPIAVYLAERCRSHGGKFIVSVASSDAVRKAIMRIGQEAALPGAVTITPLVYRNQRIADLKAAFGAGGETAAGAGHSTDRTQANYGNVNFGRRGGLIGAYGSRTPRLVAVGRARELGEARKARQSFRMT